MAFKVGENVGSYRIIEQLGQGGMATVFKAYHAALDRYVALKVLHAAFNEDKTFLGRFEREARVVAKLEHPNIVPVYDYSEHQNQPYLVMKYIEGETLKARINKGPLSSIELEEVVSSVGSALAYAHKQGILHRDIKPSNVLIAPTGVMYLADFGLARIAAMGESTLSVDSIMGTPQYISPEQAMGKKNLDSGTDIYSFGVLLYELVVGQVPFSADTPFSIIHDHIYTPLPLPMDINPQVPETVQLVLLKALSKERADRFETIDEMNRAFKAAWTDAGVPMQGTTITVRPQSLKADNIAAIAQGQALAGKTVAAKSREKRRTPWAWIGLALVIFSLFAVGFYVIWQTGISARVLPTAIAIETPIVLEQSLSPQPITEVPPATLQNGSPRVLAANDLVNQNPADPNAHLALSLALWDDGKFDEAMQELAQAANLAGPTSKDFYLAAAQGYKERNAWVPAAGMYLRLAPLARSGGMPDGFDVDLREAIYKSCEARNMPTFVFFDRIDNYDEPFGFIARGRYALFYGSPDDAKLQLENAVKLKPKMYEALLLRAEIEMKSGQNGAAKEILLSLAPDLAAPEWIRSLADDYIKKMN